MTQVELLNNKFVDGIGYVIGQDDLNEFFESNVIIPRGANRHPYADAHHEWLEDTTKVLEISLDGENNWERIEVVSTTVRIKPSEPIYEWQWKYRMPNTTEWLGFTKFMIDSEYSNGKWLRPPFEYERDESTKRIRE